MLSLFDDEIFVHARMLSLGVWFFFADWRIQCAFNIKTTLIQVRHTGRICATAFLLHLMNPPLLYK